MCGTHYGSNSCNSPFATDPRRACTKSRSVGHRFIPRVPKRVTIILLFSIGLLAVREMKFSRFESRFYSAFSAKASYTMAPGPSGPIRNPSAESYDLEHGYTMLPVFFGAFARGGHSIQEQALDSAWSLRLDDLGIYSIYHEKDQAGLDNVGP